MTATQRPASPDPLPPAFAAWFAGRGWQIHPHQQAMIAAAAGRRHTLLIAPTGGGKTLAGFLPSLIALAAAAHDGLHTLYVSPLKSLTADVQRNLRSPAAEIGLDIRIETRTGDTPSHIRQRQRRTPPQILLTTPESLALMLSYVDAPRLFATLRQVVVDEIHAFAYGKRGDQLALCLARLQRLVPDLRRVGLSATVAEPARLRAWLAPDADADRVDLIRGGAGAEPRLRILEHRPELPWAGHSARDALPAVYEEIRAAHTTIVFVNTRSQAEMTFQALWRLNDDALPIALHHGSLARETRQKVEAAMAAGKLRAVVATASLDLGVDWADVDLVIQLGAPKGVSRMVQRIGRAGHRLETPSRALLVPANRFEVLECRAALEAICAGDLDADPPRRGGLDVLAQHLLLMACQAPFAPGDLFAEIRRAAPYADLDRAGFDAVLDFVTHGGFGLRAYDRWHRLCRDAAGRYRVAHPRIARQARLNVGTIVESETLKVRLKGGRTLGAIEEAFIDALRPGDTFLFAGEVVRYDATREMTVLVSRSSAPAPKVPAYHGGKFPLSTLLARRVQRMISRPEDWHKLPVPVRDWLALQARHSSLPAPGRLLVESFPRAAKHYLVAYSFAGRNAHQTLGLLLTRRLETLGCGPLGFVANDYAVMTWSVAPMPEAAQLFDHGLLDGDLEAWLAECSLLKRTFRNVAVIAGLIDRHHPGRRKTGRQVTVSADLIYDTLRKYDPDHVLLTATRADALGGLVDLGRVAALIDQVACAGITHRRLARVSPLAVPLMLEIGRHSVGGSAEAMLLAEAAATLLSEAAATKQRVLL